jgi:hypothetical protein
MQYTIKNFKSKLFLNISHIMLNLNIKKARKTTVTE